MDVQVPGPITQGLRRRGIDVVTAQDEGMAEAEDSVLLDHATSLNRILVTQDRDFLAEASSRLAQNRTFSSVIYAPQLGVTIRELIDDLELIARGAYPGRGPEQGYVSAVLSWFC